MNKVQTSNLGYPRIGEQREWKKTLESFWAGQISEAELHEQMKSYRLNNLRKQQEKGIDLIPVNDFTYYDHVLDTAVMFGLVPNRFAYSEGKVPLSTYFAIARGGEAQASEMTKWFDTNYHYIVPEWNNQTPTLVDNKPLHAFIEARDELNINGKPVILGPFTFLKLSKGYSEKEFEQLLLSLLPLYSQVLKELAEAGATLVQIDEPILVKDLSKEEFELFKSVYQQLNKAVPSIDILLQTYFESVDYYEDLIQLPVKGIGLDFVYGKDENLNAIRSFGFPEDKILGVGIIDGRNIWKSNLKEAHDLLCELENYVPYSNQLLQPSSSLLHVPVTLRHENTLDPLVRNALSYCDEKLDELVIIQKLIEDPDGHINLLASHQSGIEQLANSSWRQQYDRPNLLTQRKTEFSNRFKIQQDKWSLPLLPTTTIGSFPQTKEVRQTRFKWRKGELTHKEYQDQIEAHIEKWIRIQEELDLDVLVHGEFERNDMVEFFGEKLDGFAFSRNGWVQSYGSRCVKPPIIFGNVTFTSPMTVAESVFAQSLTSKPVKGMLTGPVTILNWSFVRNDLPHQEVAYQIAEALLTEVKALESAGITMIQMDEPALREGLPLKDHKHQHYLSWAVEAFRMSTSDVEDTTQIHTHMCYSEFNEIIKAIDDLDADVISIETSRSHGEIIEAFETNVYEKGIGLGVYDIHSPRIPSADEMLTVIERALNVLPTELFWVNPDCGLKTRSEQETIDALKEMVKAAHLARKKVNQTITNS